jgi:hypothetical protein
MGPVLFLALLLGSALSQSSLDMYERAREELVWEDQSQRLGKTGASLFFLFFFFLRDPSKAFPYRWGELDNGRNGNECQVGSDAKASSGPIDRQLSDAQTYD